MEMKYAELERRSAMNTPLHSTFNSPHHPSLSITTAVQSGAMSEGPSKFAAPHPSPLVDIATQFPSPLPPRNNDSKMEAPHTPANGSSTLVAPNNTPVHGGVSEEEYLRLKRELELTKALLTQTATTSPTPTVERTPPPTTAPPTLQHHYSVNSMPSATSPIRQPKPLHKVASESAVTLDMFVREQKKQEQLISTLNELDRYKKRISQLEDENRRLAIKSQSAKNVKGSSNVEEKAPAISLAAAQAGVSPKPRQSMLLSPMKNEINPHDSDDSDEDDPNELIEELENRKSDWNEYLMSFADESDIQNELATKEEEEEGVELNEEEDQVDASRSDDEEIEAKSIDEVVTSKEKERELPSVKEEDEDDSEVEENVRTLNHDKDYNLDSDSEPEFESIKPAPAAKISLRGILKKDKNSSETQTSPLNTAATSTTYPSPAPRSFTVSPTSSFRKTVTPTNGKPAASPTSSPSPSPANIVDKKPENVKSMNSLDTGDEMNVENLYADKEAEVGGTDHDNKNSSPKAIDPTVKRFQPHRKSLDTFEEVSPLQRGSFTTKTFRFQEPEFAGNGTPFANEKLDSSHQTETDDVVRRRVIDFDEDDSDNDDIPVEQLKAKSRSFIIPKDDDEEDSAENSVVDESEFPAEQLEPGMSTPTSSVVVHTDWENPEEALFQLIEEENIEELKGLLTAYPRVVRVVNSEGETALHLACAKSHRTMIELMIEFNFPLDAVDAHGRSPLHHCHEASIIQLLCEEGADPNLADVGGLTPLLVFVLEENYSCVQMILSYFADPNIAEPVHQRTGLHHAAALGNYELFSLIVLESKVPVALDQGDLEGNSPLILASCSERESGEPWKMIMLLLSKGASIMLGNERGVTALHYLCANRMLSRLNRHETLIEMFIEMGADPNAQDIDGCTPLIVAVAYREWSLCKLLLEAGGDLNVPCNMKSPFLQSDINPNLAASKDAADMKAMELITASDCTASDLMPRNPRYKLFGSIKVLQTRIPGETRDRCMNCGNNFVASSSFSMFRISSGKHHCRHCHRVVCQDCSPNELPRNRLPHFVQEHYNDAYVRVCTVCYSVLTETKDSNASGGPARKTSILF